ncbi:MAG TPA: phosphoribosylformylglycinamidine synthase subunit PurS [Acidimicrobiales bacterium]|nr:phosphoribosylformylglycinamidine synthase subunit PurS [Acidimicrobiales bacterium]
MTFDVLVEVRLRPGIADPQGSTIERALPVLGFDGITGVHVGKAIRFCIDATDEASARSEVDDLCARFLTNPVIEDAVVTLFEGDATDDRSPGTIPGTTVGGGATTAAGIGGEA